MSVLLVLPLLAGTSAVATAADAPDTDPLTTASQAPPTVAIPIRTVDAPGRGGQNGTVIMRVGRSAPIRVIVDTGFSGLIVFPGAWDRRPGDIDQSDTRVTFDTTALGKVRGLRASAPMTFNGVTTVFDVPFVVANQSNPYLQQWADEGVYGLLGVGTKGQGLVNPLSALPGDLGLRWSIHFARTGGQAVARRGAIVLGAKPPLQSTMTLRMPYLGQDVNGARLWNDQATPGCWRFASRPEVCLPTKLDAAFHVTRIRGARFTSLKTNNDGDLRSGTLVRWAEPGSAFTGIRYRAGNRPSVNLTRVIPRGQASVTVGNTLYFDNVVTYNTVTGTVYISDPRAKEVGNDQ